MSILVYETIGLTTSQLDILSRRCWHYEVLNDKTVSFMVLGRYRDKFVNWCEENEVEYRLISNGGFKVAKDNEIPSEDGTPIVVKVYEWNGEEYLILKLRS